jgi:GNAT superfamily N-acetyltransferase
LSIGRTDIVHNEVHPAIRPPAVALAVLGALAALAMLVLVGQGLARHDGRMDDRADEPGRQIRVLEVQPGTAHLEQVLILAARVLAQDRYLASRIPHALESHVLAAFDGTRCTGFLRYLVQVIGAEEGRPAVMHNGEPLLEGYVEAFGVDPQRRRCGIGTALQQHAAQRCRAAGCYQMRSRSPVTSAENYALKIAAGYVLHPSRQNDSYYFLLRL